MKILLTGGGGFVGLNIAEALLRDGHEVSVLGNQEPPAYALTTLGRLPGTLQLIEADVSDRSAVDAAFARCGSTCLIHAAAITAGPERELREIDRIIDVNIKGVANVLSAALASGVERVVYVSSGSVYGEALLGPGPLLESESLPVPDSLYSITKFAGERICMRFRENNGLNVVCVRLGSVFGPWEFDTGVRDTFSLPLQILRKAMRGEEVVMLEPEPRRDWIYSRDAATGVVSILNASALPHALYNLASGFSWAEVSSKWCVCLRTEYPGLQCRTAHVGESANVSFLGERDRATMRVDRLISDSGFQPVFNREAAFADYLAWIREHATNFYNGNQRGAKQ